MRREASSQSPAREHGAPAADGAQGQVPAASADTRADGLACVLARVIAERVPAGGGPLLQRVWSDEDVYRAVRETLPALRLKLEQALEHEPRERLKALEQLEGEIAKHLADAQGGRYRLERTEDIAIGATDALGALKEKVAGLAGVMRTWIAPLVAADDLVERDENIRARLKLVADARRTFGAVDRPADARVTAINRGTDAAVVTALGKGEDTMERTLSLSATELAQIDGALLAAESWARDQLLLLTQAKAPLRRYLKARLDVEEDLGNFEDDVKKHAGASLKGRKEIVAELARLQQALTAITGGGERARQLSRPTDPDELVRSAVALEKLYGGPIPALGLKLEEAIDMLPLKQASGARRGRSGLPSITATAAAALTERAEMLLPAVKEALKTPEWLTAAADFAGGRLALGRPDHIHICGGGNTLIYKGKLIRGFMTEHLDSAASSQLKFNKIKGRDQGDKVTVVVDAGNLKEVAGV